MRQKYCSKCGFKIPKEEKPAYLKAKRVCQVCFGKRNNKPNKLKNLWWQQWIKNQ